MKKRVIIPKECKYATGHNMLMYVNEGPSDTLTNVLVMK